MSEWREYEGSGYLVSSDGRVKRPDGSEAKYSKTKRGYVHTGIKLRDGKWKSESVHRLVAKCFHTNPENKRDVNHKNGIKDDNNVDNLEWMTPRENAMHARDTGLLASEEDHGRARLTKAKVREIYSRYENGESAIEIAKVFGHSRVGILRICAGDMWKKVWDAYDGPIKSRSSDEKRHVRGNLFKRSHSIVRAEKAVFEVIYAAGWTPQALFMWAVQQKTRNDGTMEPYSGICATTTERE